MSYGAGATDPFWANVVFMTNMLGANGATSAPEYTGKTLTFQNGCTLSTARSPFPGGSSLLLNGTTQWARVGDSNDFDMGSGDFCIEAWAWQVSNGSNQRIWSQQTQSPSTNAYAMRCTAPAAFGAFFVNAGGTIASPSWGGAFPTGQFVFTSVCRSGTNFYLHSGGTMVASATGVGALPNVAIDPSIGAANIDTLGVIEFFNGNIGPVRVTKGAARYSASNYTPPTTWFPTS